MATKPLTAEEKAAKKAAAEKAKADKAEAEKAAQEAAEKAEASKAETKEDKLRKIGREVAKGRKTDSPVFVTSDGFVFTTEAKAADHARYITDKIIVEVN